MTGAESNEATSMAKDDPRTFGLPYVFTDGGGLLEWDQSKSWSCNAGKCFRQFLMYWMGFFVPLYATRWWCVLLVWLPLIILMLQTMYLLIFGGWFESIPIGMGAPPFLSLDGIVAYLQWFGGGADMYHQSRVGMFLISIAAPAIYWGYLIGMTIDCTKPTRYGWFTKWWMRVCPFAKSKEDAEMGAVGLYQCVFHGGPAMIKVVGLVCATKLTGWNILSYSAAGEDSIDLGDIPIVANTIMWQAFVLNKFASMLLGWNPTIWADMVARRSCCPYLTRFPFNTLAHPMFWSGQLSYFCFMFSGSAFNWYGALFSLQDIIGNVVFLKCVEEPYIQWFFIDCLPMPPDDGAARWNEGQEQCSKVAPDLTPPKEDEVAGA